MPLFVCMCCFCFYWCSLIVSFLHRQTVTVCFIVHVTKGFSLVFVRSVTSIPYPYLLADSSMTSRRFSLIDVSMQLNFCFTCFRGNLFNAGKKTSHTVHRSQFPRYRCTQTPVPPCALKLTPCLPRTPEASFAHLWSKA